MQINILEKKEQKLKYGDIVAIGSCTYLVIKNNGKVWLQNMTGQSILTDEKSSLTEMKEYLDREYCGKHTIYPFNEYVLELKLKA